MKKITFCIMAIGLSLAIKPLQSNAANTTAIISSSTTEAAQAKVLLTRLHEINAMDKSNLTSIDKKNLRTEVKSIKQQLVAPGGIYISVGALLIIILLLIILL